MPAYVYDKKTNELVKIAGNAANADLKDMNVYSTEEKIVGTWIDGKPIYRRVLTSVDSVSLPEVDTIVQFYNMKRFQNLIYEEDMNDINYCRYSFNTDTKTLYVDAKGGSSFIHGVIEYTKTTD